MISWQRTRLPTITAAAEQIANGMRFETNQDPIVPPTTNNADISAPNHSTFLSEGILTESSSRPIIDALLGLADY